MGQDRTSTTAQFAFIAGVSVLVAAAVVIGRWAFSGPLASELREQVPLVSIDKARSPDVDAEYVADRARLLNDMGRRPSSQWSADDTSWLVDLLKSEPGERLETKREGWSSRDSMDEFTIHISSLLVVSTHLKLGAPLPDEVVGAFEARVVADLAHWDDKYRRFAIASNKDAGWLGRQDIRPIIEAMRENDPAESIRNLARRSLLWADGLPVENLDDCPTCPGKPSDFGGG